MPASAQTRLRRSMPLAYAIAILGSGLVISARLVPEGAYRSFYATVVFLGAVSAAGAFGGWKPGFLTTALSACGAALFLVRPYYTFRIANTGDLLRIVGSVMAGIAISLFCEALHRALARIEDRQQRLQAALQQLQLVTESMSASIVHCSRDLRYLWVSKSFADSIGLTAGEIVGRPIVEIVGREAFDQLRPRFEQVLTGQKVNFEDVFDMPRVGRRWIHAIYTPTLAADGAIDGWVGAIVDTTERRKVEEALRQSEEALKNADRRKDEFLATLAHELRNPLAPICNAVELLQSAPEHPSIAGEACHILNRQLAHLVRLIDDLLEVSRITRGKLQLRKERIDLATAIHGAIEATRPLIDAAGHVLTVSLPAEPVFLDADSTRISQIFSNLLNNAAKYAEKGGHIWLTAHPNGEHLRVSVRDTGIGIAPEHLSHIFEMFSQVVPALDRSQGGLGIGLALVRGLLELHGGTIEVHSDGPGQGSEFVVRLPLAERRVESTSSAQHRERDRTTPQVSGSRILVVDDNPDTTATLALLLERTGHRVHVAHDGLEAVHAAAAFQPDVVLLDIGLPKLNGFEVAQRIRQGRGGEKVALVAVTGWGQQEDRRRAMEAGFDHHLTKPVEIGRLMQLLSSVTPANDWAT